MSVARVLDLGEAWLDVWSYTLILHKEGGGLALERNRRFVRRDDGFECVILHRRFPSGRLRKQQRPRAGSYGRHRRSTIARSLLNCLFRICAAARWGK